MKLQKQKKQAKKAPAPSLKNTVRTALIKNQRVYRLVSGAKRTIKNLSPQELSSVKSASTQYETNAGVIRGIKRPAATEIAVVIHLYYTENWELFKQALENLSKPFDIFVTLPKQNAEFAAQIKKDFARAHIFEVPNRGRDVLPFLQIAQELEKLGFKYVLKVHSKKSPHRKDGDKWFKELMYSLLPRDPKVMAQLLDVLQDDRAALVGPKGQYISLMVNFPSNGPRIAEAISNIYYPKLTDKLIRNRRQHGFFAGTMFWARLDAIRPILDRKFKVNRFDAEKGQIDATFAHAIERVFCLVPQIEKRDLYEIGPKSVKKIDYKTSNIPDWSEVYIGPKPIRKNRRKP